MRCWRCAKENQDGLIKCVVCASELDRKVEPWFCRTCFRRCLQEACSLCGSDRAAGLVAASKAANSVVSREVTSKLRSRRYSKWIANAKHTHTNKKPVFDLGAYDGYSTTKSTNNTQAATSSLEEKQSSFEKLKNEILARNRPTGHLAHSHVGEVDNINDDDDSSFISMKFKSRQTQRRLPKMSNEDFVALLWDALQIVSMHAILDHAGRAALRITSSIANLLPRPLNMNIKGKFAMMESEKVVDSEANSTTECDEVNDLITEAGTVLPSGDRSALLASRARRRKAARDLENAKRDELTSARQRRAAATAANLAAIALEHSRLPTPPTARHWFLLMKRSHFQKYGYNSFLFKFQQKPSAQGSHEMIGRSLSSQLTSLKRSMSSTLTATAESPITSRPASALKKANAGCFVQKIEEMQTGNGEINMKAGVLNQSKELKATSESKPGSGVPTPNDSRTPKNMLYGGRMLGEAAARQREKERLLEKQELAPLLSKKKLVIDVRGGGNAVNVVCCCAGDLGWKIIKNKKVGRSLLDTTNTDSGVNDVGAGADDGSDDSDDDDSVSSDEESEESDSDDSISSDTIGNTSDAVATSATAGDSSNRKRPSTTTSASKGVSKHIQEVKQQTVSMGARPSTSSASTAAPILTQSSFKPLGYADVVWLADYHVHNNLATNLTKHGPRRRLRNFGAGYAPSRAEATPKPPVMSAPLPDQAPSEGNEDREKEGDAVDSTSSSIDFLVNSVLMNEFEVLMLKYEKSLMNKSNGTVGSLINGNIGNSALHSTSFNVQEDEKKWRRRWVNHFPGMNRAVSKSNLGKELNRYFNMLSPRGKKAFQFFPKTFLLPEQESEAVQFLEESKKLKEKKKIKVNHSKRTSSNNGSKTNPNRSRKDKRKTKKRRSRSGKRSSTPIPTNAAVMASSHLERKEWDQEISSQVIQEVEDEDHEPSSATDVSQNDVSRECQPIESPKKKAKKTNQRTLIIKPSNGSQGKGIVLVQNSQELKDISFSAASSRYSKGGDEYVCQEYMSNPLLLHNLKFDLRIYVLLAASEDMDHVDAWLCEEGLARFATCPYQAPDASNLQSQFMHLTNYSLNKDSKDFIADGGENDHKRPLTAVFNDLERAYHVKSSTIWRELGRVAAHTVSVISPQLLSSRRAFAVERERIRRQAKALKILKTSKEVPVHMPDGDEPPKVTSGVKSRMNSTLHGVEGLLNKPASPPMLLPCCFQIIGIDVMLVHEEEEEEEEEVMEEEDTEDDVSTQGEEEEVKVKAILIEINSNPALSIGHKGTRSAVDERVKRLVVNGALYAVENWNARLKQKHSANESMKTASNQPGVETAKAQEEEEEEEEFEIDGYFQIVECGKWIGSCAVPNSEECDDDSIVSTDASISSSNSTSSRNVSSFKMPNGVSASEVLLTLNGASPPGEVMSTNDQEIHRVLDLVLEIRHCFEACAGTPIVCFTSSSKLQSNSSQDLSALLQVHGCSELAAEVAVETWGGSSYLALSQLLAPGPEAGEEPRWQLSRNQFVQFGRRCLDPNSTCLATASLDALFAAVTKKGYLTARRMGAIDGFESNMSVDRAGRQHMNFSLFLDAVINLSKLIHLKSGNTYAGILKRRPSSSIPSPSSTPSSQSSSFPSTPLCPNTSTSSDCLMKKGKSLKGKETGDGVLEEERMSSVTSPLADGVNETILNEPLTMERESSCFKDMEPSSHRLLISQRASMVRTGGIEAPLGALVKTLHERLFTAAKLILAREQLEVSSNDTIVDTNANYMNHISTASTLRAVAEAVNQQKARSSQCVEPLHTDVCGKEILSKARRRRRSAGKNRSTNRPIASSASAPQPTMFPSISRTTSQSVIRK